MNGLPIRMSSGIVGGHWNGEDRVAAMPDAGRAHPRALSVCPLPGRLAGQCIESVETIMLLRRRRRFFANIVSTDWSEEELAPGERALPFEIRRVRLAAEFDAVLEQRAIGYRLPSAAYAVDAMDFENNGVLLAAFDKRDDRCLGSIRLVLGDRGPNEITEFVRFDQPWRSLSIIEARRFVVPRSAYSMKIKVMLMKALYSVAADERLGAIVATSAEGLASTYRMMHFQDLAPGGLTVMPPGSRKPVTVVAIEVARLKGLWAQDPELANFYRIWFEQVHPDLKTAPIAASNPLRPLRRVYLPEAGARHRGVVGVPGSVAGLGAGA